VNDLSRLLADGMAAMHTSATPEQGERLLEFLRLLQKWNRVYNLTSIENPAEMVRLHLLDSLLTLPYLHGTRILDVGTGAGLPGIPLAVMAPDKEFVLLDSSAKKTRFVQQAAIELGLQNVRVVQERIEKFRSQQGFDTILCRAFASLSQIVALSARLLAPNGVILAQKGRFPDDELQQLENVGVKIFPAKIPGVDAERHLIEITV
jgi:16S rRNA (guanine527-N7)-methyltransferase